MLYDQNYVILKDYNKHIYQELLKAINEQYQYDGKYIDKVAVLDSIQTRLWDCMEEMVNQQESLEDVLLRMMGSRYRYLTRDILMGYWNREGGLWPMVDQTVILKDYDLYEVIYCYYFRRNKNNSKYRRQKLKDGKSMDGMNMIVMKQQGLRKRLLKGRKDQLIGKM